MMSEQQNFEKNAVLFQMHYILSELHEIFWVSAGEILKTGYIPQLKEKH